MFCTLINESVELVDNFKKAKAELKWDEQDYDEQKEEVYHTITDIYYELYLNRDLTVMEIRETVEGKLRALSLRVCKYPVRRVSSTAGTASRR